MLGDFLPVGIRNAVQVLKQLKEDKSTGPDGLSAKAGGRKPTGVA